MKTFKIICLLLIVIMFSACPYCHFEGDDCAPAKTTYETTKILPGYDNEDACNNTADLFDKADCEIHWGI